MNMIPQNIRDQMACALKTLDERERMVMALYYLEHLTLDEIGLVLNIDRAAVERLTASGMKNLRAEMMKGNK